jgi:hypothetical protein
MKKRSLFVVVAIMLLTTVANADIILFEDFEDATVNYTTSVPEFTNGSGDFFIRTDGSDHGTFVNYNNIQGSSYFATMDIDGEGAALPVIMDFTGINITGYTDLSFSSWFAEDDDGTNEDWDNPDYVHIDYQIDGGGFQNLLHFENDGSTFNTMPYVDTDFDGIGDGTALTDSFALFTENIAGTGSTLDIRITYDLDSGDEDIAIDNLQIAGNPVPVPGAIWLLSSGLLGLVGLRRRQK